MRIDDIFMKLYTGRKTVEIIH